MMNSSLSDFKTLSLLPKAEILLCWRSSGADGLRVLYVGEFKSKFEDGRAEVFNIRIGVRFRERRVKRLEELEKIPNKKGK